MTRNKLIGIALAGAVAAACSGMAASAATLNFGCQYYGSGMDPAVTENNAWNCTRYGIGECLFHFDDAMEPQYYLCDDYTMSDDHITWTFHIREGVKFSDGCDVTASVVAEYYEHLFTDYKDINPTKFFEYDTMTADDETGTLTIVLKSALPDLRKNLCHPMFSVLDLEHSEDMNEAPIGTGPYVVTSFTDAVGVTLVKNENYWNGEVPFDDVNITFVGDASAKAMALESHQIDLTENIASASDLAYLQSSDDYTVSIANGLRTGFAYINHDGVLANDALRQAVQMAIDHDTECTVTVGGLYNAGYSVLPSNLAYNYDQLTNPYSYDVDAAITILDEAGIVDTDGDGIRELDGENIVLDYITYENRCLSLFAAADQTQLASIGISCNVEVLDSDTEWNRMMAGEYDLCDSNWTTASIGDPQAYLANWYSDPSANYCAYQNEEYDALYEQLMTELDADKRVEIITQLQQILIDDAAVVVHGYYCSSMMAYNEAVTGAQIHSADYYWITTEIKPAQ